MNENTIIYLFEKYWLKMPKDVKAAFLDWPNAGINSPGVNAFEACMLYFLVLENNPKTLFEMGMRHGAITFALSFAQRERGIKNGYMSTEINKSYADLTIKRLENNNLIDYVDVQIGNGIILAPDDIDMCVIDADHTYNFAKKYIKELFPKCLPGCLIFAHDHIPYTQTMYNTDGQINLAKDIIETHTNHEQRAIKEFLFTTKTPYCFLEAITGGRNTPFNEEFNKTLISITNTSFFGPKKNKVPTSILYSL